MKAIQVKFMPATNTRPSRLKAMAEGVKPFEMGKDAAEDAVQSNDAEATSRHVAERLCERYGWGFGMISGQLPSGDWVFCFIP